MHASATRRRVCRRDFSSQHSRESLPFDQRQAGGNRLRRPHLAGAQFHRGRFEISAHGQRADLPGRLSLECLSVDDAGRARRASALFERKATRPHSAQRHQRPGGRKHAPGRAGLLPFSWPAIESILDAIGKFLRERGILFCVDAIQTLGAFPTSARHVDFLAADAHKWLLGPCAAG
jgi:hypothetical protein